MAMGENVPSPGVCIGKKEHKRTVVVVAVLHGRPGVSGVSGVDRGEGKRGWGVGREG